MEVRRWINRRRLEINSSLVARGPCFPSPLVLIGTLVRSIVRYNNLRYSPDSDGSFSFLFFFLCFNEHARFSNEKYDVPVI